MWRTIKLLLVIICYNCADTQTWHEDPSCERWRICASPTSLSRLFSRQIQAKSGTLGLDWRTSDRQKKINCVGVQFGNINATRVSVNQSLSLLFCNILLCLLRRHVHPIRMLHAFFCREGQIPGDSGAPSFAWTPGCKCFALRSFGLLRRMRGRRTFDWVRIPGELVQSSLTQHVSLNDVHYLAGVWTSVSFVLRQLDCHPWWKMGMHAPPLCPLRHRSWRWARTL